MHRLRRALTALFGDRLAVADRQKLERWSADVEQGLGTTAVAGLFGSSTQLGLFVAGDHGDGAALSRATETLPDVASIAAVAAPLKAFLDRLGTCAARTALPERSSRAHRPGARTRGCAPTLEHGDAVCGRSRRGAPTGSAPRSSLASGDASARLAELLEPEKGLAHRQRAPWSRVPCSMQVGNPPTRSYRASKAPRLTGVIVVTVGSDRKVAWSECVG